jgi:erythrocyte band 7 integral membrane protein
MQQKGQFAYDKIEDLPSKYPREDIMPMDENDIDLGGFYQNCIFGCGECCGTCKTYIPCLCCVDYPYLQIDQSFVGLYERFGQYVKTMGPGLQYFNPCTDVIQIIDVKTRIIDLAKQTAITRDNITVIIDATVYFNIVEPRNAHYLVSNINKAVRELSCSTLRTIAGQYVMQDLLEKRQDITDELGKFVARHVHEWGIEISNILIKDIIISAELQETLSSAAKERRLAESKIITAKADVESAKLMRQTADILSSKSAMQIRYLETIKSVTANNACKVIFISDQ